MKSEKGALFTTFFRIGLFTFGGGYAMIPLIEKEAVEKKGWITKEDMMDMIAIAESTPGPIAVNAATFVGYQVGGIFGAFFATLGVVLPSFVLITLITLVYEWFRNLRIVQSAFWGIRAGVLALVIKALISMYRQSPKEIPSYLIMAFACIGVLFLHWNVLLIIVICAIFGLVSFFSLKKGGKQS